ncbi:hypothetical protein B0H14DRAFT_2712373 [Mycena olivaceomarginata]|nr:hypothetical protein B0H14DRAFT_2712373 [Mycena olivaceomarginata]
MGSIIAIRKCWSVIPILFCCFLPPSSSLPHPSSTPAALSLLHPPRPRGTSLEHSQYMAACALPIQLIIAAVRKKEPCRGGMHTKGGGLPVLRGGTCRTWIWVCLKYAQFFSGGPGADTSLPIGCTCAPRRSCANWRDRSDATRILSSRALVSGLPARWVLVSRVPDSMGP